MTDRQRVYVAIDRLVVDGPVDEGALKAALAVELGRMLAGPPAEPPHRLAGGLEQAAATTIAHHVQSALPGPPVSQGPR